MLKKELIVLDKGYVKAVRIDGFDEQVSQIAGISHLNEKGPSVKKLLEWGHTSPFEFCGILYELKCPIFVARQIMRQRMFNYMEKSLRYCEASKEYYVADRYNEEQKKVFKEEYDRQYNTYLALRESKVKKEIARGVLGTSYYTTLYLYADLRNLMHFFDLRLDKSAQYETRQFAKAMAVIFSENFPNIADAYFIK